MKKKIQKAKALRRPTGEQVKHFAIDTLFDLIGATLYSAGIHVFVTPANFAPGGLTGLSLIINHYLPNLPIGALMLLFNVPIVLATFRLMGKKFFLKSLRSMVLLSLMLDLVFPYVPQYTGEPLLAAIFGGVLAGAGLVAVYWRGSSTGGTDFIIMAIRKKKPFMSIGMITLFVDGCVIVLGGLVFGYVDAVLYGIIMTFASTLVIDKVMQGLGSRRMAIVITTNGAGVIRGISEEIGRGVTLVKAIGTYTGEERQMLMCACAKSEIFRIRRIAYGCDSHALVLFTTLEEAYGLGFSELKEN